MEKQTPNALHTKIFYSLLTLHSPGTSGPSRHNANSSCKNQLRIQGSGSLKCLYNLKNSSKWTEINIKEPHNLQGCISPLQKYQLSLVDQLFSRLVEDIGMFHLKLWLLKSLVNFKEPFSVLIKHLFTAVDVPLEWKTIHSFLREHFFWSSMIIASFTLGLF